MSKSAEQVLEAAMALPEAERAEVAARLQETVGVFSTPEIAAAWRVEIARRIKEADVGGEPSISEEEVDRMLKERFNFLED